MKQKIIIISLIIVIVLSTTILLLNNSSEYNYEWVDERNSIINQSRLFVNDSSGKHIDGKVTITYLNGKSEEVSISKDGVLYVRSIIKNVKNPKKDRSKNYEKN